MKSIEIDEKVEQHLSTNEKRSDKLLNPESKGIVTIEGEYATLMYERRLSYPREVVWKTITDPKELAGWMNTKAVIDRRNGGTIDFVNTVSGSHTTGRILVWDPLRVFEHEWHIAPNPSLLMVNLKLLSVGSSSRMAIQIIHSLL